jgi:hypothetical protein
MRLLLAILLLTTCGCRFYKNTSRITVYECGSVVAQETYSTYAISFLSIGQANDVTISNRLTYATIGSISGQGDPDSIKASGAAIGELVGQAVRVSSGLPPVPSLPPIK